MHRNTREGITYALHKWLYVRRPTTLFQVLPNNKRLIFRIHRACKSSVPGHVKASSSCMHKKTNQIQGMYTDGKQNLSSYVYCSFICMKHIRNEMLNKFQCSEIAANMYPKVNI